MNTDNPFDGVGIRYPQAEYSDGSSKHVEQSHKPNVPVYLIRTNYYQKDANNVDKLIDYLYENDIVSINVRNRNDIVSNNVKGDDDYYCALFDGKIEKRDPKKNYINLFYKLVNDLKNSDVIVIAHYVDKNPKIGLIKKSTKKPELKEDTNEVYKLYYLQMESVRCISDDKKKRFLSTLVPENLTISPIQQKQDVIYSMYYGIPIPFKLSSVSNSNLEVLCAEYLRSCYSYKSVRVLGKNYPDIDIIGYKTQGELFAAQVSSTETKKLIEKKKEQLCSFVEAKHKIMFSTNHTDENSDPLNYDIQEVWDYFVKNDKKLLERLIEM